MQIFRKIYTEDLLQQRLQDSVASSFQYFEKLPQLDSVIVENVVLTSGVDNQVEHKLNRKIVGWQIIRKNANADVWESSTANNIPSSVIILRSSATVTVSFIFF